MANRVAASQIWATAIVLGGYGVWGLMACWRAQALVPAIGPAAAIVAAAGVGFRQPWSRPLVLLLALLFVGRWLYSTWFAVAGGFYRGWPPRNVALSHFPCCPVSFYRVLQCSVVMSLQYD